MGALPGVGGHSYRGENRLRESGFSWLHCASAPQFPLTIKWGSNTHLSVVREMQSVPCMTRGVAIAVVITVL